MGVGKNRKVLLIENSSEDFISSRLPYATYLVKNGWDVYALVPKSEANSVIQKAGINVSFYSLNRKNKGVFQLLKLIPLYRQVIKKNEIDIIHSFRFQPNLINVLANFFNKRKLILHVTGLGIAFSRKSFRYIAQKYLSKIIFLFKLLRADRIIVQNLMDKKEICVFNIFSKKVSLILGSGVDINFFDPKKFSQKTSRTFYNIKDQTVIFVCVTRLIWEKGIKEMVDAFESLHCEDKECLLWIVGWPDLDNPRHVELNYIEKFAHSNVVKFVGKEEDVRMRLSAANFFLFPSYYREGIPRSLLEALSMGKPIITTDMPGCNLTVENGENGFLIEPYSSEAIRKTVLRCSQNDNFKAFESKSRIKAELEFSNDVVYFQIMRSYES